jgi:rubrerythrin
MRQKKRGRNATSGRVARPRKGARARSVGITTHSPADRAEFLARAWALEVEAAERYATFADAMSEHNNPEVAELFRKLARIEQLHADQLLEEDLSGRTPAIPAGGFRWKGGEGPETAEFDALHYRMQPYHALQIALECEKRANRFFTEFAAATRDSRLRKAAREMAEEEAEHVRLIEEWIKRTPPPDRDWQHDPDPPVVSD